VRGELDHTIERAAGLASAAPWSFGHGRLPATLAGFVFLVVPSRGRLLVALRDAQLVAGRAGQANNAHLMPGGHGARQRGDGRGVASNGLPLSLRENHHENRAFNEKHPRRFR